MPGNNPNGLLLLGVKEGILGRIKLEKESLVSNNKRTMNVVLWLTAALLSVLVGTVAVSAQGPTSTPTKTNTPSGANAPAATATITPTVTATKTITPAAATATKTTAPATPTASATLSTTNPVTKTATPTKAVTATVTRTPTKAAAAPRAPSAVKVAPAGTYASQIACVNMSSVSAANISFTFYASDSGAVALSFTDPTTVPTYTTRIYFVPSAFPTLTNPFVGSAVVSSDQPMGCETNTTRNDAGVGTSGTPARIGTSEGIDSSKASTVLFVPQLFKNFGSTTFNSFLAVQNTEVSPITVTVSYTDRFGTAYPLATESVQVPGQSNHVFYQSNNGNLPDGIITGAVISGTGKMAAVASVFNGGTTYTTTQYQSYAPAPAGANKIFVPRFVRNYHAFNGGISLQNVGSAATSATVTFTFNGTNYVTTTGTINPGATWVRYAPLIPELAPVDALSQPLRFGSAVIQAAPSGLLVANVNEDNRGVAGCNGVAGCTLDAANQEGWAATYMAVPDGTQTLTVFIPEFMNHVGSPDFDGGYQIANTTGSAGTCNLIYPTASLANESGVVLPANGSISRFGPNVVNLPSGYDNSVVVTCTQPVIGIVNFSARNATYYGDSTGNGNAINQ